MTEFFRIENNEAGEEAPHWIRAARERVVAVAVAVAAVAADMYTAIASELEEVRKGYRTGEAETIR